MKRDTKEKKKKMVDAQSIEWAVTATATNAVWAIVKMSFIIPSNTEMTLLCIHNWALISFIPGLNLYEFAHLDYCFRDNDFPFNGAFERWHEKTIFEEVNTNQFPVLNSRI